MNKEIKFIHITKTGGTSIENCGKKKNILWGKYHKEYSLDHHNIFKNIPKEIKIKYDWFTVVRNPYSRIISEFHCPFFGHNSLFYNRDNKIKFDNNKFNEWIQERIINRFNYPSYHFIEQYLYIDEKININILKYENLKNEFELLMSKYNLDIILDRHDNNSEKKFTINNLTNDTILLINKVYYNDFIKFNYSFL